ncbi:putative ADG2 [Trypanosoma theileri]|uniref:Putative ADG2 n=1 Tax=Trypanosoma theileri TaxID=67003 RepID=A0A1X0NP00_9TRYP|nr:putative ADG2 [Trypanosoma theileri]ORC86434.1 putative ADG2 [Trypanosoma theileri]
MPRKDRDVWDPPEDRPPVEAPPSEFLRHFADRAVRVGKDGSNAQLVRVHHANGNQRNTEKKKNNNHMNTHPTHEKNNNLNIITAPRRRGQQTGGGGGGIMAPDELQRRRRPIIPPQQIPGNYSKPMCSNSLTLGQLPGDGSDRGSVRSVATVNGVVSVNNTLVGGEKNLHPVAATAAIMPQRLLPLEKSPSSHGERRSPEVVSVEPLESSRPVESFTFPRVPLENMGVVLQTGKGLKLPLARLPPRKMNWQAEELMPKPNRVTTQTPSTDTLQNNGNEYVHSTDIAGRPSTMQSLDNNNNDDDNDNNDNDILLDDSLPIPLYQPTGLLLAEDPFNRKKGNVKKSEATTTSNTNNDVRLGKKKPGSGTKRPASDKGPFDRSNTVKSNPSLEKPKTKSAPSPGTVPLSLRLPPLEQPQPHHQQQQQKSIQCLPKHSTASVSSGSALTDAKDEEQEDGKKKPITYKCHNLKEYRILMERVANQKRGGLGPADTDEQRQAKEKMLRQRQYGELVEKQAAEMLREKQQQRLQQQQQQQQGSDESGENRVDTPAVNNKSPQPQQPPPPERIQAQERRARALEYARNIPKPELSVGRKQHREDESTAGMDSNSPQRRRTPQEEAEWRREKRLMELEAKHHVDRERVAAVKRYLGC